MPGLCCPLCGTLIYPTQQTMTTGRGECHVACLTQLKVPMIGPASGA
jgi:hypothetical protein